MWSVSKALHIPLDKKIETLPEIPYTISFVIRKRQQIDSLNELPQEKRPPEKLIWDGSPEELDSWLERVLSGKEQTKFEINIGNIEG